MTSEQTLQRPLRSSERDAAEVSQRAAESAGLQPAMTRQQAASSNQEKEIAALKAALNSQAIQIQKVSDQLALSKSSRASSPTINVPDGNSGLESVHSLALGFDVVLLSALPLLIYSSPTEYWTTRSSRSKDR